MSSEQTTRSRRKSASPKPEAAPADSSPEPQASPSVDAAASDEAAADQIAHHPDAAQSQAPSLAPDPTEVEPNPEQAKRMLEALIFVAERPIGDRQLARAVKLRTARARELLAELVQEYSTRGIELCELSGGFQFRSAPTCADVVRGSLQHAPVRLTRAQLESLALVAYRQPITRPEIDDVRGVDSGSALRVLLERGLLKMLGRKDEPGRPLMYGTTPYFLEFFSMRSLKDLPTLREFTELSDENRALFKQRTGETVEEAEAALLAAEEAARVDEQSPEAGDDADDERATLRAPAKPSDPSDPREEAVGEGMDALDDDASEHPRETPV